LILLLALLVAAAAGAQEPAVFRSTVDLVVVPVVVRDSQGRAVGTLKQEDFRLFDKGKAQAITRFSLETGASRPAAPAPAVPGKAPAPGPASPAAATAPPDRFIAYVFDDIHATFGELARTRDAVGRHLASLNPTDRAALFSTSGDPMVDFTTDRDALHTALGRLSPHPRFSAGSGAECPSVTYYQANLIENMNDACAYCTVVQEVYACHGMGGMVSCSGAAAPLPGQRGAGGGGGGSMCTPRYMTPVARSMAPGFESAAKSASRVALQVGAQNSLGALDVLRVVARRLAAMPGQRMIVVLSPGFLTPPLEATMQWEKGDVVERATRAGIIISSLDARGLYSGRENEARTSYRTPEVASAKAQYERSAARAQTDVLAEMAESTGGTFFRDDNDLDAGLRRVAAPPEYYYVLGFTPQKLKADGTFHNLKVTVKAGGRLTLTTRRGYFAPKTAKESQ
jgi:VWFA-related protein